MWIWIWIQVYVAFAEIVHAISELSGNCLLCMQEYRSFCFVLLYLNPFCFGRQIPSEIFFSSYLPKLTEVREEFSGFLALRPRKKHRECGEEN